MSASPSQRSSLCGAIALVALAVFVAPTSAAADFSPAELLSGTASIQFSQAGAPAVSQDGHHVVFQGVVGDVRGVFERNMETGQVTAVATSYDPEAGSLSAPDSELAAPNAAGPSVSANGQYVAFTTTADLEPLKEVPGKGPVGEPPEDNGCPEVYVRDMNVGPSAEGAYTLASALNEKGVGIAYGSPEHRCPSSPGEGFAVAGAQAAAGVAMSADGRRVAFTVLSESNLDGESTEPSQVAVRDLATETTTLVTVVAGEGTLSATKEGGAYPSAYSVKHIFNPVGTGGGSSPATGAFSDQVTASSAAISGDGTTVAWLGTNVPAQVLGAQEIVEPATEVEPLWRRIADGNSATTKRLLGEARLDLGFLSNNTNTENPVRSGSLVSVNSNGVLEFIPPALSADGRTVAMIANAPSSANLESAKLLGTGQPNSDAYVARVTDSAATPAVSALTATPTYDAPAPAIGDITDVAMSPDGTRVAFNTTRTEFTLPSLAYVSPPNTYTNASETYEANLALGTLRRVTSTYNGVEPNGPAELLSLSGDDQMLAFGSGARNLIFGDAIQEPQVYAVHETPEGSEVASSASEAPPASILPAPVWLLSATAVAQPDGSVVVDAQAPGAGTLEARATTQAPEPNGRHARARPPTGASRRARGALYARRRAAPAAKRRHRRGAGKGSSHAVPTHTVARAALASEGPSALELHLHVLGRYGGLVSTSAGLYSIVRVTFAALGQPTLTQEIPVTFRRLTPPRGKVALRGGSR